jgi:hypothetical protein
MTEEGNVQVNITFFLKRNEKGLFILSSDMNHTYSAVVVLLAQVQAPQ